MSDTAGRPADWPSPPAWLPPPAQPAPAPMQPTPWYNPPTPYPGQYTASPYPAPQFSPSPYVPGSYQPQPFVPLQYPAYAPYQSAPRKSFLPVELKDHPRFFQVPARRWWWGLIALVSYAAAYLLILLIVILILDRVAPDSNPDVTTPMDFLTNNLAISMDVLMCPLIAWLFYRQGFGWLVSVVGRVRWRWLGTALGVFAIGYAVEMIVEVVYYGPADYGFHDLAPQSYTWFMIFAVVLTTPLQSAAEEFQFRALLSRLVAGIVPFRRVGLVLSALLTSLGFMTLHFADDHWLQINYFCVGLMMWWLAYRTGGIEAPIAFHIVNNLFSEWMLPFTDISDMFDRSVGTGSPVILFYLAFQLALVVIVDVVARRRGVARLSAPSAAVPVVVKPRHWVTQEAVEVRIATATDLRLPQPSNPSVVQHQPAQPSWIPSAPPMFP